MTHPLTLRRERRPLHSATTFLALACVLLGTTPIARAQQPRQKPPATRADALVASGTEKLIEEFSVFIFIANLVALGVIVNAIDETIHTVLDLPKPQREEFQKIKAETRAKVDAYQALPAAERNDQMLTTLPAIETDFVTKVDKILNAEQRQRFLSLVLQLRGPSALTDPGTAEALKLSEEQQQKLADTLTDYNGRLKKDLTNFGKNQNVLAMGFLLLLRKERDQALLDVLTAEQKEEWTKLKGKPHLDVEGIVKSLVKKQLAAKLTKPKADAEPAEPEAPKPDDAPAAPKPKK